jgi:hypothetical protein
MPEHELHVPVPGLLSEDGTEAPLLEASEELPSGMQVKWIQDMLPLDPGEFEYGEPEDILRESCD